MGTLVGHVAPGFGFLVIGLWHLFNHIKLYALQPTNYKALPWFSSSKFKYLELFLIMAGCSMSIAMELFIGPDRHQPFDPDGTIPSNHLHNFEHSLISVTFLVYAAFAIVLDRVQARARYSLTQLLGALAFGQQLILFHLHSADHMGIEGQYHLLLQIVILVCLVTTLMGIGLPKSFSVSFVRSLSIVFQGVWFMVMGFMLWTPGFMPKGCFMNSEEGHQVVRCSSHEALHRAKSLVNIEFSTYLVAVTIFAVSLYLGVTKIYGDGKTEYRSLKANELGGEEETGDSDLESQQKSKLLPDSGSFIHMGKAFQSIDMER